MTRPFSLLRAPADSLAGSATSVHNSSPCCVGIDKPEIGLVHADNCIQQGRPYQAGHVPETLHAFLEATGPDDLLVRISPEDALEMQELGAADEHRNSLLIQLLFAARDLAESRIAPICSLIPYSKADRLRCRECGELSATGDLIEHAGTCRAGRILRIISDLSKSTGKEAVPGDGEGGRAGDGIHLRGLSSVPDGTGFSAPEGGAR